MDYGKYRQHYGDLYPAARRHGKKAWAKVAVALAASYCLFFCALLLTN